MLDIKIQTVLEIKKEDRIYKFECPTDSPLGELHDALALMKNYVVQRIAEADKQAPPEEV